MILKCNVKFMGGTQGKVKTWLVDSLPLCVYYFIQALLIRNLLGSVVV